MQTVDNCQAGVCCHVVGDFTHKGGGFEMVIEEWKRHERGLGSDVKTAYSCH